MQQPVRLSLCSYLWNTEAFEWLLLCDSLQLLLVHLGQHEKHDIIHRHTHPCDCVPFLCLQGMHYTPTVVSSTPIAFSTLSRCLHTGNMDRSHYISKHLKSATVGRIDAYCIVKSIAPTSISCAHQLGMQIYAAHSS